MLNPHASVSSSVYSASDPPRPIYSTQFASIEEDDSELYSPSCIDSDVEVKFPQSAQTTSSNSSPQHDRDTTARNVSQQDSIDLALGESQSPSKGGPGFSHRNSDTPRVDEQGRFLDPDSTPTLGGWNGSDKARFPVSPELPHDPQRLTSSFSDMDLAKKFQRLSTTLQKVDARVLKESQKFQASFTLKVVRAKSINPGTSRTSQYYQKVNDTPGEDEPAPHDALKIDSDSSRNVPANSAGVSASLATLPDASSGLNIYQDPDTSFATSVAPLAEIVLENQSPYSLDSDPDTDMSVLFIRALHAFDATELQSESVNSVCLSFSKGDVAFVRTIDDSGWGEVTLVETLDRGWVPMNFFSMAVSYSASDDTQDDTERRYGHHMWKLFNSCGRFLMDPISHTTKRGTKTFSTRIINEIRNGVRLLLEKTDSLSRSNEIVTKKPVVRRCRKKLLSDWYNLMLKANDFRGTANYDKIEILTLLAFQVIRRAVAFFDVWLTESSDIIKRESEKALLSDLSQYPLLGSPPMARQRVTEICGLLYSYLALIVGRLDIIEHNPAGCDMLESVVHHIILLFRELLFISKTSSSFSLVKHAELDDLLDELLSLVSEIVMSIKSLAVHTMKENEHNVRPDLAPHRDDQNLYTPEGRRLLLIAARMITTVKTTIHCIRRIFDSIGDYRLSTERAYPDYTQMRIDPVLFINRCTGGLAKSHSFKYRAGNKSDLGITANGVDLLHNPLISDTDDTPFGREMQEFQKYRPSSAAFPPADAAPTKDELVYDENGGLVGESLRGLVYTLTDETVPPDYFFVSAFFLSFRHFASVQDLIERLVARFEVAMAEVSKTDALVEIKMKNRKKLVCKILQIWLESYWDADADPSCLATLFNFFNECVFTSLPLEAMALIETAARLVEQPVDVHVQLVPRDITLAKLNRKNTMSRSAEPLSARYSMIDDGYELSRINTNSSVANSLSLFSLGMPLGISGHSSPGSALLSKNQTASIESFVTVYRQLLGAAWCSPKYLDAREFLPVNIEPLLRVWADLCQQLWVVTEFKPRLVDFNALEVAKQLTLIESEIFCSIGISELTDHVSAGASHLRRTGKVHISVLFTNCFSGYVLESILQPDISLQKRTNILKTWLKVAISCLYLRNFNSLAAIVSALQSHMLTRITRVWSDLSDKYRDLYDYLCSIVHPDRNYRVYRNKLKSFLLANEYNIPVVPYFSLFIQDLTLVSEGNPNYRKANTFLGQKLVNIDKYMKLTRVLADFESFQIP